MAGVELNTPTSTTVETRPGADVTPTGLSALTVKSTDASGNVQLTGSSGNDRATLFDLERDKDQVISLGAGDDVFVFGANTTRVDLNGIVKMGDGNDRVFMNHLLEDYVFTLRSDGGIKIEYIGEADGKGDAVTFYDAESFTFRNIAEDGVNYTNQTFSHDDLYAQIIASGGVAPM